ncbi:MAG: hypothetical protein ACKO96_29970 [Flammeovirgaceae bacterium]
MLGQHDLYDIHNPHDHYFGGDMIIIMGIINHVSISIIMPIILTSMIMTMILFATHGYEHYHDNG